MPKEAKRELVHILEQSSRELVITPYGVEAADAIPAWMWKGPAILVDWVPQCVVELERWDGEVYHGVYLLESDPFGAEPTSLRVTLGGDLPPVLKAKESP